MRNPIFMAAAIALGASPCWAALDADGDGVSDLWQQLYPGLAPGEDSDGDGFTNAQEAVAGTDPLDPADRLRVSRVRRLPEGDVSFVWQPVGGKSYAIERLDVATGEWTEVTVFEADGSEPAEVSVESTEDAAIFRLKVRDRDADADGLTAWEERMLGFSDASATSSGEAGRLDYAAAYRLLEGSGTLTLSDGRPIERRPTTGAEASRFLAQASFGADSALIDHVATIGICSWLDEQLDPAAETVTRQAMTSNGQPWNSLYWTKGWWKAIMTGPDQLRQRMGYALSQILVVSAHGNDLIRGNPWVQADYYDMLLGHSFGNYRELLEDVTYSTQMGFYLSHLLNRKSDPSIGRFPDENFAREIMQLFTIGLWELNDDGTRKLDEHGEPLPTYDNDVIMEMAKVFTGFGFGGPMATSFFAGVPGNDHVHPMKMWDDQHEPGEKRIFRDIVIPAGQTGEEDVADVLDALCEHPNVGPFVGRLLVQRFTTSNPSPEYVARVAAVWNDNGAGVRGDLKAVTEAILLDPEARVPEARGEASGKVREPYLRLTAVMRAFKARNSRSPHTFPVWTGSFTRDLGQQPLWSPSVFNFYLPDHRPAGEPTALGLVAPELEIATADRLIATSNFFRRVIDQGMDPFTNPNPADVMHCDFAYEQSIAGDAEALVAHLDELLTWGRMSPGTRQAVVAAVEAQETPKAKVDAAVHLITESPDFVVLK